MRLEITGHCREECVGEIRRVTKVNTQGFCSTVAAPASVVRSSAPHTDPDPGNRSMVYFRSFSTSSRCSAFCAVSKSLRSMMNCMFTCRMH